MAEPVRAIQAVSPIMLEIDNIRFEGGKLWRPRYESLIDYSYAPEDIQFEPAFLVYSTDPDQEIEVVFRLADSENAIFDVLPGGVRCQLLAGSASAVSVKVDDPDFRSCQVVWKRSGAPLTTLHIACRPAGGWPLVPDALTWVEGGVYLVIMDPGDPGDVLPAPDPAVKEAGDPVPGTVRLLGIDEYHQPVYDLFVRDAAPPELGMEPAFRAGHGERLNLRLALDLPDAFAGARLRVDADGQAEATFSPVGMELRSLVGIPAEDDYKACTVQWNRSADMETGETISFNLLVDGGPVSSLDPTVIEPPACDANGVCSPPRNCGQGGVSAG